MSHLVGVPLLPSVCLGLFMRESQIDVVEYNTGLEIFEPHFVSILVYLGLHGLLRGNLHCMSLTLD